MKLKEFVIFLGMVFLCVGFAYAEISFIEPTPLNNSRIYNNYTNINVSIPVEDLTNFTFNWNGTNTTYLNDSCVLHLSFNNNSQIGDSSTVVRDVSSYNNNGSFTNGSTGNWTTDGKWNGAMSFDGVNDYVNCGNDTSLNNSGAFTVSSWGYCTAKNTHKIIIGKWGGEDIKRSWYLGAILNMGELYLRMKTQDSLNVEYMVNDPSPLVLNRWFNVVGIYDDTNLNLYLDGTLVGISAAGADIDITSSNVFIGALDTVFYFNDIIDEVRIYNRALSPAEVRQSYLSNLRKFNESQWYFETNQTDLTDGEYNYQGFANNNTITYNTPYNILTAILKPHISCYSAYPETLYTNYTGFLNSSYIVESNYPLNMSSLAFLMGTNYTLTNDYYSYLKVPPNDIADDGIYRAHNRNTTPYLSWESNDTITEGNVWKWGGGDNDSFWISKEAINATHTWINITGIASNVFPSMFYLGRLAMYESPKTGIEINKGQGVIFKFWDLEKLRGRDCDFWVRMFFDTQIEATPSSTMDIWFCNNSFDPAVDDPVTCEYCLRLDTWSSIRWLDHEDYQPHSNVSYSKPLIYYAGEPLAICPDEINYIYLTSDTQSSKSYILNATNSDPGICNLTYAQTQTMWLRDEVAGTNTPYAYTPSFFMATVRDYLEFTHHLYIANDQDMWGHSEYCSTPIGISNVPPTHCKYNYFWWDNTTDYYMNGSYEQSFWVNLTYGTDPDNGEPLTHVLSLYDDDYNFIAFVNSSLTGNQTDVDIWFDITDYKANNRLFILKIVSTDNEGSTSVSWSPIFELPSDNTYHRTIEIIKDFPFTISNILTSFLSYLPLFVGILISGFFILVCVGVFSKFKRW